MSQLDPRSVVQIDVEDDANRFIEIGVAFERLRGRKQDGFVVVLPEQPLYCPQHCGVVIDH
jgi:D-serine dehydratase